MATDGRTDGDALNCISQTADVGLSRKKRRTDGFAAAAAQNPSLASVAAAHAGWFDAGPTISNAEFRLQRKSAS